MPTVTVDPDALEGRIKSYIEALLELAVRDRDAVSIPADVEIALTALTDCAKQARPTDGLCFIVLPVTYDGDAYEIIGGIDQEDEPHGIPIFDTPEEAMEQQGRLMDDLLGDPFSAPGFDGSWEVFELRMLTDADFRAD